MHHLSDMRLLHAQRSHRLIRQLLRIELFEPSAVLVLMILKIGKLDILPSRERQYNCKKKPFTDILNEHQLCSISLFLFMKTEY